MEVNQLICPHCNNNLGAAVDAYIYGSPLRQCGRCKAPYLDHRYHEIALEGIRPEDLHPSAAPVQDNLGSGKAILIGVGILALFVVILFFGWIVFPLPIIGIIFIVRGINAKKDTAKVGRGKNLQALKMEKQQSYARMQNPDYVKQLRRMGYAPVLQWNQAVPTQTITCSRCGNALDSQDRFCPTCGNTR